VNKEQLKIFADEYGSTLAQDLLSTPFVKAGTQKIPYEMAKECGIIPIDGDDDFLKVAISDPSQIAFFQKIQFITLASRIEEVFALKEEINAAIDLCYRQSEEEATDYIKNLDPSTDFSILEEDGEYDLLSQKESSTVIKILNMILLEALQQGVSDIHLEPTEKGLVVRYRIDGVLQVRHHPPKEIVQQLLTRIKVIAKLDIAERRLPQDGRIKLKKGGKDVDFRVSTIPVVYGERIVLRILDQTHITLDLNQISMAPSLLKSFRSYIRQNQGIILVTGPTGSGKTTTLYSAISDISSSEVNIMTIEDPVEYKLSSIAQIGVNPKIGLNFAKGLRHILRQDPDVILIGEIRDKETADIAIQASLTGHLVLSTLHTNDAPSAITRLVDMGLEPYLISSSVLAILAQRLVRKICPHCKIPYIPTLEELMELNLADERPTFFRGKGCDLCFHTGYKGREAIYEFLEVKHEIKEQFMLSSDATSLQRVAIQKGMKTLRDAGICKVKEGITTSAEVLRTTRQVD
jgi:general secretion pathway protein E